MEWCPIPTISILKKDKYINKYKTLSFLPVKKKQKKETCVYYFIIFQVGENENVDENKSSNHKIPMQD